MVEETALKASKVATASRLPCPSTSLSSRESRLVVPGKGCCLKASIGVCSSFAKLSRVTRSKFGRKRPFPDCGYFPRRLLLHDPQAALQSGVANSSGSFVRPTAFSAALSTQGHAMPRLLGLTRLKVDDRKAPMTTLVARTVIHIAKKGERDPERLSERVIRLYRVNPR